MSNGKSFYEYVRDDLFADIDGIYGRPMFGGYGFYKDGIFFALIADGKLYFKVGANNLKDYEKHESGPFVYSGHNNRKPVTMSYWKMSVDILENKDELEKWVEKSVEENIKTRNVHRNL